MACAVASVTSQSLPTQAQTTCFSDYLANNPTSQLVIEFATACANVDFSDSILLCDSTDCLNALSAIFGGECGFDPRIGESYNQLPC